MPDLRLTMTLSPWDKRSGTRPHQAAPRADAPQDRTVLRASLLRGNLRGLRRQIVQMIARSETGILLTSYDQLRLQRQLLLGVNWGYAILDEGHKIRNPDAEARRAPQPLGLCTLIHTV